MYYAISMGRGDGVRGEEGQRPPGHESTGFHRSARPWRHRRHSGVPARGPLRSSNVAAMACGAHESARIASRRATRRRGLEDTTITRAGAATATSRNDFFDPRFLSYCSLWTTNEAKAPRTTAWSGSHANLVCQLLVAPARLLKPRITHTAVPSAWAQA